DDLSVGSWSRLDALKDHPLCAMVTGDVLDEALVERLVGEAALVYHLAAVVGVRNVLADPLAAIRTNVHGTELVLAAAARHQTPTVIASTSEVYGRSEAIPFAE